MYQKKGAIALDCRGRQKEAWAAALLEIGGNQMESL